MNTPGFLRRPPGAAIQNRLRDSQAQPATSRKRKFLEWILFALLCCGVLFAIWLVLFGGIFLRERQLAKATDHREVALGCIELLGKSDELIQYYYANELDSLPPVIRSKHAHLVHVDRRDTGGVIMEFGGGFYHYGYRLEAVPSEKDHWRLLLYAEDQEDRELVRIP